MTIPIFLLTALSIALLLSGIVLFCVSRGQKRRVRKAGLVTGLALVPLIIMAVFVALLPYSVLATFNTIAALAVNTPPMNIDKAKYFPEHTIFEDPANVARIQAELTNVLKDQKSIPYVDEYIPMNKFIGRDKDLEEGTGWRTFMFKMDKFIESNCAQCPFTASLIRSTPRIKSALFSILDGNKVIPKHTGYFKGFIRYQLALRVPEPDKSFISVHDRIYHWKEGEGIAFDDMFEHYVVNAGSQTRVVLYLDIERDFGNRTLQWMSRKIMNLMARSPKIREAEMRFEKQLDITQ